DALPNPSNQNVLSNSGFLAPATPLEESVTAIIAGLLGLQRVGADENFFLIGGHSLLGTQVIARIRETFGVEVSLRSIFDLPTAAQLAKEIERLLKAKLDAVSSENMQRALHHGRTAEGYS